MDSNEFKNLLNKNKIESINQNNFKLSVDQLEEKMKTATKIKDKINNVRPMVYDEERINKFFDKKSQLTDELCKQVDLFGEMQPDDAKTTDEINQNEQTNMQLNDIMQELHRCEAQIKDNIPN